MSGYDSSSVEHQDTNNLTRQKRILSFAFSKKIPPLPQDDERPFYPNYFKQFHKFLFFTWMLPLIQVGYLRTLQPEDMPKLNNELKVEQLHCKFDKIFSKHLQKLKHNHLAKKYEERNETPESSTKTEEEDFEDFKVPAFVLVKSLYFTFFLEFNTALLFKIFSDVLTCLLPLIQKALINFVSKRYYNMEVNMGQGVGYAVGVCLMILMNGICINHSFYQSMMVGSMSKAILTKSLLLKSFTISAKGKHKFPMGTVNTLMGADLSRVDFAAGLLSFGITFPIPFTITIVLLIINIGPIALVGLGLFFFSSMFVGVAAAGMLDARQNATIWTDKRVNLIKELLKNFKVVKLYSWENAYSENVAQFREKEMKYVSKLQLIRNSIVAYAVSLPNTVSMITFLCLYGLDTSRSAADIFSSLTLFNVISNLFLMVPMSAATAADAVISLRRVGEFIACPDVVPYDDSQIPNYSLIKSKFEESGDAVQFFNASFMWDFFKVKDEEYLTPKQKKKKLKEEKKKSKNNPNSKENTKELPVEDIETVDPSGKLEKTQFPGLNHLNLFIKKGEFLVITGQIGTGKSSLLSAISGFMKRTEGIVNISGSLVFCGQPWVQNSTVRENIVFGTKYDEDKYKKVINVCALENDLEILPAGDFTQVGERGITLSGGQKARINLARAVYASKDIILMDDVLSAVDAKVGKDIMNKCILGMLRDKTRVLATHHLSVINKADRIIFLNGDGSIDVGTLDELRDSNTKFVELMNYTTEKSREDEASEYPTDDDDEKDYKKYNDFELNLSEKSSKENIRIDVSDIRQRDNEFARMKAGKLVVDEEKAVNRIKNSIYISFLKLGSGVFKKSFSPLIIILGVLSTFTSIFTNTWLSFWIEKRFEERSDGFYIGIYVMFTMLTTIIYLLEFSLIVYFSTTAARLLNVQASKMLVHTPMSFIDKTPMGRIINRFTKDTDVVDNELIENIRMFFLLLCIACGILILCITYLPWFAIAIPFLFGLFIIVADYYQASAREIKRLEAIKRSIVYAHFNESLSGMEVLKAYGAEKRFIKDSDKYINDMNECYYITIANQRWLGLNLDIVACWFSLLIAMLCVTRQFNISPASAGLLLIYVLDISGIMSFLLRSYTQLENEMNSVERLNHYACDLEQEAPFEIPERDPHPDWPAQGAIQFDNVSLRYREDLPTVLKNVNLVVKPNERIGICGRTGAGKSSIMTALYRLVEISEGSIFIDGVDISKLGLHKLRSKLSIIPQDPVLFSGSIRTNLDPFNKNSDDELWESLRVSGLIKGEDLAKAKLQNKEDENLHKFHLEQDVEDDGANFSLGERQLIALARALIRNSKILILDEATSSVDYETDAKIQQTIATEFSHCTILCIAHRLKTIIDYDRILVLDKGEIAEFDKPKTLYQQTGSIFRSMCDKSGVSEEDFTNNLN